MAPCHQVLEEHPMIDAHNCIEHSMIFDCYFMQVAYTIA